MAKRKKDTDFNVTVFEILNAATEPRQAHSVEKALEKPHKKNPAAVAFGRLGGAKGGPARAAKPSAKKRQEIAKKAAKVRWG